MPNEERRQLASGGWPWKHRTLLAPMEGVTQPGLRELIASYGGVGLLCTEFVRITASAPSSRHLARQVVKAPGHPLSVQVMGNHEDHMAQAAALVALHGADVVDINLGCPAPKAVKKGVGSAMLKDLDLLYRVIHNMRARTEAPLSAKMRAGFDTRERAIDIAKVAAEAGVDFITVHPRRRVDYFRGAPDHRIVRDIKAAVAVPVVANGDLWGVQEVQRVRAETSCDAVMIGRPALRNPWLFAQLQALDEHRTPFEPDGPALLAHIERFITFTRPLYPRAILGFVKEQLHYLLHAVPASQQPLRRVLRLQDLDAIRHDLEGLLAPLSARDLALRVPSISS